MLGSATIYSWKEEHMQQRINELVAKVKAEAADDLEKEELDLYKKLQENLDKQNAKKAKEQEDAQKKAEQPATPAEEVEAK